jgi:hypothetical protein
MIELATSVMFLASAFYGKADIATTSASLPTSNAIVQEEIKAPERLSMAITMEAYVRDYYHDTPILAEIARCESTFRHFGTNGKALRGKVNSDDIGVMQINDLYHYDRALKMGINIYTVDGNLQYAKYLYDKQGTAPWISSSKCWQTSESLAKK